MRPAYFSPASVYASRRLINRLRAFTIALLLSLTAFPTLASTDIQRINAEDLRTLLKEAERSFRRGEYVDAEKRFRRATEISPTHSGAKLGLALVHIKQRRLREAYELSFAVAKAEPNNANAFAVLGATLLTAGRFKESRAVFYNALRLNKREALALAGYGMLAFYENNIHDSIGFLSEAVYRDGDEPDYYFALAQVSARAERYEQAAEAYNRFLVLARHTDSERRMRIKGLINFLRFLGQKQSLYVTAGNSETSVPIEVVGNRPVVKMRVNGREQPLRFVLDTGSGISVISERTAKHLKIEPVTKGGFAKGIGGDGRFEIIYGFLKEVEIGDVSIRNVPVYIRKFHDDGQGVDGYIGLSLISKFLTTLDYGAKTFALTKKDPDPLDVGASAISLPLRLTSSGFLSGEVQLEGVEEPLNFIVDTGASVSVISHGVASHESISAFTRGEKLRVVGSAGVTNDVPSFLLPRVSFGTHSRRGITAIALDLDMINEASGFEQAGILGGNFLRNFRMTFDFKNSKVTFVPITQEQ
jgi:predicted aspartyl protease/Flp pilus assembly protein TadD